MAKPVAKKAAKPRCKPVAKAPARVGRPTKYEPRFCDEVEADMAAGYSLTAFAGKIGVDRNTLDLWREAHPEFMGAVTRAKAKRLRFWEQTGISVASKGSGGPGAATVIVFGLKNMGDDEWSAPDKKEITGKDGGPIQTEQVANEALASIVGSLDELAAGLASHGGGAGVVAQDGATEPTNPAG